MAAVAGPNKSKILLTPLMVSCFGLGGTQSSWSSSSSSSSSSGVLACSSSSKSSFVNSSLCDSRSSCHNILIHFFKANLLS
ncbi:hypothetical protein Pmani_031395 [Petrolisthes manimaculis]|uniref:Uncharacterized protein n=1 Tax=Petrolisthes manimaculis TaxID=1843537 RepID=A0AAE1TSG9_9EUCA|nr:hypothetical protein Pmani_031395 [Petrolisthes manimaculis]